MKSLAENLQLLLGSDKALTIQKTDEGFIITFSDMEEVDDESLIFVPERMFATQKGLEEAIDTFYIHYQMSEVRGYQA